MNRNSDGPDGTTVEVWLFIPETEKTAIPDQTTGKPADFPYLDEG
jgi:hypothetical protein